MAFNKYPYTDFNEYNLDWIIMNIRKLLDYMENVEEYATQEYVDTQIAAIKAELLPLVNKKVDKTDFDAFVNEVYISLTSMNDAIGTLRSQTNANAQAIVNTYNELKSYIDQQIYNIEVIDPLNGEKEPLQIVLNHMANFIRNDALTADEYDSADLTATAYDALLLTAYDYDNFGKNYIS